LIVSLRTRLLLSYLLVVVTCLAVIGLALLLLLRDAPVQKRLIAVRLSDEAAVIQRLIRLPLQNNLPPQQVMRRLEAASANPLSRLLLINDQTGEVLADSDSELTGRNLFELGKPQAINAAFVGEFELNGARWIYSSRPAPDRQRPSTEVVALAQFEATPALGDPIFQELIQPLMIAGLLALIISIALAVLITRSVTQPLRHVAQAAQRIAQGNYTQPVPVEGSVEVKEVAVNFNQMAQTVRDSQQVQRDLLANVTHELKTPLTSIQGFAQAIKDGAASEPDAVRKSATIIYDEAARMGRMVGELLELARIESGQAVMRREAVQIDQVLRGVVEKMTPRAQHSNIALNAEIPEGLPAIAGDGDRLAQVFGNLIDNAIKHTPASGKVTLTARLLSGSSVLKKGKSWSGGLEISVADTGAGIPQEDLSRIFERFYQVDKSRARARSGGGSLGLGLSIVKEIVTAHGGSIHAESVVGLGTRFVIVLPIERAAKTG
jgi:signal transduction histidine kinase